MSIYLVSSSVLPKPTNHLIFAVCINPPVEFKYENNCVALPWPDPGGETDSISPSGYGPSLFRTIPATIFPIANTGATLRNGHKRAQDIAALAVELGWAQILVLNEHRESRGTRRDSQNSSPEGEALLWRSAPVLPTSGRIHCSVVTAASATSSMTATSTSTMEAASTVNASHSMRAGRTGASSSVESSPAMESRRH